MEEEAAQPPVPSYREILRFYFPLAVSWLFMALEVPITTTVVARSAQAEIQSAALLFMGGLALWIESPVIDLLATSTTLTKGARSFGVISRFVWWVMAWCTAFHAAIALTPLYDGVAIAVLGIPREVAEAARIPMAIMIPWSACIGWRRYQQGILIRFGQTRVIGFGTGVRVATMAAVCFGLFAYAELTGVTIAAIALVASVFAEAVFIHWASRATVNAYLRNRDGEQEQEPLTMDRLVKFHLPLTATTMTFLLSLPLVSGAIARAPDSVTAMAAWQIAGSLIFLHRTVVFALPEPVIALYNGPATARKLARFCLMVGIAASGSMVLVSALRLDQLALAEVLAAPESLVTPAALAYLACAALPLMGALQSYLRGMLTAHHFTTSRLVAVLSSTLVLLACLWLGIHYRWSGIMIAAFALNCSALAELAALAGAWRLSTKKLRASAA